MRRSVVFALLLLCAVFPVFTQTVQKPPVQLPPQSKVEPFKIKPGSSFAASVPRKNSNNSLSPETEEAGRAIVIQDFEDAMNIIRQNYVDGNRIDNNALTKSSLTLMLRTLDPHSNYHDPADYQELLNDQHSEYSGIGCSIANYLNNGLVDTYITSTHPDSPAFRAGLLFGDKLIAINGEKVSGKASVNVREKIRGAKGTMVRLTVERVSGKIETLEIRRNTVPQPSIPDAYLLRPGVGYISLSNGFNYTTSEELNVALNDLHDQGMTSLVLDLRDNPGGIVDQAVKVAGKFLPAGKNILSQRARLEGDNQVWRSADHNPENIPLVVLVNGNSASATEIVTAALQDYDRAIIVGERTFGKGLVQSVIDLPFGSGLTLTTAKYYTPSGRSIQRDYSKISTYDYFQHKVNAEDDSVKGALSKTITGRTVYGGNGIQPDEIIKKPELTSVQTELIDPIFFFAREIAGGRIQGFESYKISRPIQYGQRVRPSNFIITDELFDLFKNFAGKNKTLNISNQQLDADKRFIIARLRYNLATAAFGSVAANQVLIEDDLQVAKAVEVLPHAQNLFAIAKEKLQKSGK